MRKLLLIVAVLLASVAALVGAQDEETFALTIMHTNDVHAGHEPNSDGNGGQAIMRAVVEQIRAEGGNNIFLDAGDRFTGTLFHTLYLGQDNVQIMNLLGYDAMTLGNHEFDNGDDVLKAFIEGLEFPVTTANITVDGTILEGLIQPSVVLEVGDQQVGVIGLVTPETPEISSPGEGIIFSDDLAGVVQDQVNALTEAGVNKIIVVSHIGIDADIALAEAVTGVDVIVGGHSHTLFGNQSASATVEYPLELESSAGEPLLIVQEGSTADYLGRLDVEFDADGVLADWNGDSIFLSQYITPDAEMDALVQELAVPLEEIRTRRVGDSSVALVGDRRVCRVEECNLGNLITDAMRNESGAQIAITNGGGIRADIDEGEVTLGEVLTVLPFGNLLAIVELRGADVIAALELGVSSITVTPEGVIARDGAAGRFPQVSGIAYTFDPTQEVGSRIVSVTLEDGSALDPEAVYTVVTNDFMRRGGDGYVMFAENAISFYDFGKPLDQVLADYIAANGPVAPELEGRITATVGYTE
jgi:5'-nucleotidase